MSLERRLREADNFASAINPYLRYYTFVDSDRKLFALTKLHMDDLAGFHPGDVEDGLAFVGYLIAKDMTNTTLDTLLVFERDSSYIVGSTVGGMVLPIDLKDILN